MGKKVRKMRNIVKVGSWSETVSGNQRKTPLVIRMSRSNRDLDDFWKKWKRPQASVRKMRKVKTAAGIRQKVEKSGNGRRHPSKNCNKNGNGRRHPSKKWKKWKRLQASVKKWKMWKRPQTSFIFPLGVRFVGLWPWSEATHLWSLERIDLFSENLPPNKLFEIL